MDRAVPEGATRAWEAMGSRRLSQREEQILLLASQGMANKEIGGYLYLSEQTVKNHMSRILRKLGANDRAHAVMLAMKQGML